MKFDDLLAELPFPKMEIAPPLSIAVLSVNVPLYMYVLPQLFPLAPPLPLTAPPEPLAVFWSNHGYPPLDVFDEEPIVRFAP